MHGVRRLSGTQVDVKVVLNIEILLDQRRDTLRWSHTREMRVSVRSAYHSLQGSRRVDDSNGAQSTAKETSTLWLTMWKAKVWPKVQNFMWKLFLKLDRGESKSRSKGNTNLPTMPSL